MCRGTWGARPSNGGGGGRGRGSAMGGGRGGLSKAWVGRRGQWRCWKAGSQPARPVGSSEYRGTSGVRGPSGASGVKGPQGARGASGVRGHWETSGARGKGWGAALRRTATEPAKSSTWHLRLPNSSNMREEFVQHARGAAAVAAEAAPAAPAGPADSGAGAAVLDEKCWANIASFSRCSKRRTRSSKIELEISVSFSVFSIEAILVCARTSLAS